MSQTGPADSAPAASQSSTSSTLTALGLVVIAGVTLFLLVTRKNEAPPIDVALSHPAVGMQFPEFAVEPISDGEPVAASDISGKVTLISFWGPWCPPCVEEFPHLTKLAENLRDRPEFRWLPVAYGNNPAGPADSLRDSASAFLSRNGYHVTSYHDPKQSLINAAAVVGAFENSFPCTVLLDKSGRIHAVWNGYRPGVEKQVESSVLSLLK